jgi:Ni,Fe-hydrogenase III component G
MMERYKNEKLKQLKSSIQEALNESRVLSHEEVEITLRQNGLTMIADHLKETLKTGIMFNLQLRMYQCLCML